MSNLPKNMGKQAFSLVELLISMAVLSLGMLALVSTLYASVNARSKSKERTAAYNLASNEIERCLLSATEDFPAGSLERFWSDDFPQGSIPFLDETTMIGGTEFRSTVHTETLRDPGAGTHRLKRVDVSVVWFEGEKRGHGRLKVSLDRLVAEP